MGWRDMGNTPKGRPRTKVVECKNPSKKGRKSMDGIRKATGLGVPWKKDLKRIVKVYLTTTTDV